MELLEPGYKKIRIQPQIGEHLTWVDASLESVHGTIKVTWKKQNEDSVEMQVLIPSNTTAEIIIPTMNQDSILESGTPIEQVIGLSSVEQMSEGLKLLVGSGDYYFKFPMT
ncbi:alpha-L-rhamnosidase C-terminal domain-containing protein [Paenibacillus sp. FSL H7-0737]|uniref:alpha-L-rhamnosidase C-terminal domain-containing protein n=1 Tax=Paenibacillus sp. FSL H7-0737 TaxID=1536775 RepID=UPI0030D81273